MPNTLDPQNTPLDLDSLTAFLNALRSYNTDLVQSLEDGKKLCHYTTLDGAIGIISGQDLWLTNSRFLNDESELEYGRKLIEDELKNRIEQAKATRDPDCEALLRDVQNRIEKVKGDSVYIACFCERDNLLSQWRGYADNGGGVSIEFRPVWFQSVAGPDSPQGGLMRLWKVFYSEAQQRKIVNACLDYPGWPAGPALRASRIVDALEFFLPTFKKEDFSQEEERRLIFSPKADMSKSPRFRNRGGMLVPYFSLRELVSGPSATASNPNQSLHLDIAHVLVGPSRHKELNVESLRMLMLTVSDDYRNVPVEPSSTPYRG